MAGATLSLSSCVRMLVAVREWFLCPVTRTGLTLSPQIPQPKPQTLNPKP